MKMISYVKSKKRVIAPTVIKIDYLLSQDPVVVFDVTNVRESME